MRDAEGVYALTGGLRGLRSFEFQYWPSDEIPNHELIPSSASVVSSMTVGFKGASLFCMKTCGSKESNESKDVCR